MNSKQVTKVQSAHHLAV